MIQLERMGANLKNMKHKNVTRLKTFLVYHRVLLVLAIMGLHVTETSPYLARRSGQFQVTFPATNHLGKDFTRHIQRRADTVGSYSTPQATRVLLNKNTIATNKLGMSPIIVFNSINDTPSTLNTLMTPPPPTTDTDAASTSDNFATFTSNFYRGSNPKKDQRYAMNFHTGRSDNFQNKGHFNKNIHISSGLHKNYFDEKEEASKRYAMSFHSGASNNFNMHRNDETSTSSSNIIPDYTSSSSTTNNYDNTLNTYFYDQTTNNNNNNRFNSNNHNQNTQNTLSGKGFTSSSSTANHVGHHNIKQQHHLQNIKHQLLQNTGFSNNFQHQNYLHTNHLGTGNSNTNFHRHSKQHPLSTGAAATLTSSSNLGLATSPAAPDFRGGNNGQTFPTTASATVGASISFSQNSAQQNHNPQQPEQPQQQVNNQNWQYNNNQNFNAQQINTQNVNPQLINNQNFNNQVNSQNFNNQVNNQNFHQNQQQNTHTYPTGFDPRSQSKLPWAHNRFPTQYRPPSAAATAPSGGSVPFAHHHLHSHNRFNQHGYTGASTGTSVTAVRPSPGDVIPVTQSSITPTFGFGTTGSQYAAVRDPAQLPTAGRQERIVTPPSVPPEPSSQQTPPPPPPPKSTTRQTATTLKTTTQRIEKIQDTTEPVAAASESATYIESSTSRAGYGWGPEGAHSGGKDEDGGIANVFVDIVTSKIKSIQSTINGIQTAIKSAKRSSARKIANKIEGIGQFVNAVTKGVGGIFEAKANKYSDKGWGKGSGGGSSGGGYEGCGGCSGGGSYGKGSGGNYEGGVSISVSKGGKGKGFGIGGEANFGSASGGNNGPGGGGNSGWGNNGGGNNGNNNNGGGASWGNGGGGFGNSGGASGGNFGGGGGGFNNGGNFGGGGGYNNGGNFGNGGGFGNGGSGSFGSSSGGSGSFGSSSGGFGNSGSGSFGSSNGGFNNGGGYDSGGGGFNAGGNVGTGGGFNTGGNVGTGSGFGTSGGFNAGFDGGSNNIPESSFPNNGISASSAHASAGGGGNVQGGVISVGNPNPFEGTAGSGSGPGGYSWNQG